METYLNALGYDIWQSFVNGYIALATAPTYQARNKESENNAKAKNEILCGFELQCVKVMHGKSTKGNVG